MSFRRFGALLGLLLGISVLLAGCQTKDTTQQTNTGKINIITSLDFYGQTAKRVAGKYGNVTAVIDRPSIDPHDFEPTVKTAKQASNAQLIIYNGIGYDDWMQKLIVNKASGARVIEVGTTIANQKDGSNEHVWYDPTTMPKLATKIAADLAKIQPQHKAYFYRQARAYQASLKPITTELAQLKRTRTVSASPSVNRSLTIRSSPWGIGSVTTTSQNQLKKGPTRPRRIFSGCKAILSTTGLPFSLKTSRPIATLLPTWSS